MLEIVTPDDGHDKHGYISTACAHALWTKVEARADWLHGYCQADVGPQGSKLPGTCKWCAAKCQCLCHE